MSIYSLFLNKHKQDLSVNIFNKEKYGEIFTPFHLIEKMFDLLPSSVFSNQNLKWLDPCAGRGAFGIILYRRLFKGLITEIKEPIKRHHHIIKNMIFMVEINPTHMAYLYSLFGEKLNIINDNYLDYTNLNFDIIVGNPPFNVDGFIKPPTKKYVNKKHDGKAIWRDFIINSIDNLDNDGILLMITPSMWMKKDDKLFEFIKKSGHLNKIHTLTNTETNKIFNKQAQTPTCYFVLNKRKPIKNDIFKPIKNDIFIWDNINLNYYKYLLNLSLPLKNISIISKIFPYTKKYSNIPTFKTNMPFKKIHLSPVKTQSFPYQNISTCIQKQSKPTLIINYSNYPCKFFGTPKIVLAHKMHGMPYYDISGEYGISNRDNYVIMGYSHVDFLKIMKFLSSKLIAAVFDSTRYRMMYLEKYAFDFIPDITKIKYFPEDIKENTIADFFQLNSKERNYIKTHKTYIF